MKQIIDAHLDLAWNAVSFNRDLTLPLDRVRDAESGLTDEVCRGRGAVSLPELRRAGVRVCVASILARSGAAAPTEGQALRRSDLDHASPAITHAAACGQLAYYRVMERQGELRAIRCESDLLAHWSDEKTDDPETCSIGYVLSMEGCDPILSPDDVSWWWNRGLRVASLSHYGQGRYAAGTGADGGLTDIGIVLLEALERHRVILDVTHLTDDGLDQALGAFGGAVMASHHNCRALVPGQRQLSDRSIRELAARGGVIGIAMDAWMLQPGWSQGDDSQERPAMETVADHIDHVCQTVGNPLHVGIGSDLDGGFGTEQTPAELDSVVDLQRLCDLLARRGYTDDQVDGVFFGNWLRFFFEHLPAEASRGES